VKSEALEASDPTWTPASAELVRRELSRVRGHLREVGYADGGVRAMGLYTALEQLFA
jgi:hypothetical protein